MILRITDNVESDVSLEEVRMSIDEFADIANHPFIASSNFDAIVIDLDKRIPFGYCKAIVGATRIIPKYNEINSDSIRLLSECFPEYAAPLRSSFIRDKAKLEIILSEMCSKYSWDEF